MQKIFLTILLVAGLNAEIVDGVAIVVKGEPITLYDVQKEMEISKIGYEKASDLLIRKALEEAETKERKIKVTSGEVYDDIKKTAKKNGFTVNEFYEKVREKNGLSSADLKAKVKHRLLSQKLYSAIAYAAMNQPKDAEIKEYYELNKEDFTHPSSFDTTIYQSKDRGRLQEKVDNPMFYAPDVTTHDQVLPYDRISPTLASLLEKTSVNSFSSVIPDGKGGYMSFYVKGVTSAEDAGIDGMKSQIVNKIMTQKREQVLSDYFARLRHNAEVRVIRAP